MKLTTIIGARPQFIKASVVSRALISVPGISEVLVHTGQHYDQNMSDVFFRELGIPEPKYNLGIGSGRHGEQTGKQLAAVETVLLEEKPDWVLVYGDTNSTLAGALAAAKLHIPTAHVEAGLRSFNKRMPEEINRIIADHCSELLFAPTKVAVDNLLHEGVKSNKIHQVGDVMYDVALYYSTLSETKSRILEELRISRQKYILATIHRAENTDNPDRLRAIMEALALCSTHLPIVLPLHPRTKNILSQMGWNQSKIDTTNSLKIVDPVGYLDMVNLEKNAAVIATDSGGVQKEAFFYKIPCVTLRDETEWVELIQSGWNRLCPLTNPQTVSDTIMNSINSTGQQILPYGDGKSAELITNILCNAGV